MRILVARFIGTAGSGRFFFRHLWRGKKTHVVQARRKLSRIQAQDSRASLVDDRSPRRLHLNAGGQSFGFSAERPRAYRHGRAERQWGSATPAVAGAAPLSALLHRLRGLHLHAEWLWQDVTLFRSPALERAAWPPVHTDKHALPYGESHDSDTRLLLTEGAELTPYEGHPHAT